MKLRELPLVLRARSGGVTLPGVAVQGGGRPDLCFRAGRAAALAAQPPVHATLAPTRP